MSLAEWHNYRYDVSANGQRFVMIQDEDQGLEKASTLTVVENWATEFKK